MTPTGIYKRTAKHKADHKEAMLKPETRERIREAAKKRWAKERKGIKTERPKKVERPKEIPQVPDTLGFKISETRENLIVFPVKDIIPRIVFDFQRNSIRVEIPEVFGLTSGNLGREEMENLAKILHRDYSPEKHERLDVAKRLKFVKRGNKDTIISRFFEGLLAGEKENG